MSPRTKKRTTGRRGKRANKARSFKGYLVILLIAVCVGFCTYFLLNHFYGKTSDDQSKNTINKIEKYLDKQKQEIKKNSNTKFDSKQAPKKPDKKDEIKFEEPSLEPKTTIKDLNLTSDELGVVKSIINSMENNDTNLSAAKELNVTKPKEKIHIEIIEKNITKKDDGKSVKKGEKAILGGKKSVSGKPKLVIIIDDIAYKHQADAVKSINLKLTPSIFPSLVTLLPMKTR